MDKALKKVNNIAKWAKIQMAEILGVISMMDDLKKSGHLEYGPSNIFDEFSMDITRRMGTLRSTIMQLCLNHDNTLPNVALLCSFADANAVAMKEISDIGERVIKYSHVTSAQINEMWSDVRKKFDVVEDRIDQLVDDFKEEMGE